MLETRGRANHGFSGEACVYVYRNVRAYTIAAVKRKCKSVARGGSCSGRRQFHTLLINYRIAMIESSTDAIISPTSISFHFILFLSSFWFLEERKLLNRITYKRTLDEESPCFQLRALTFHATDFSSSYTRSLLRTIVCRVFIEKTGKRKTRKGKRGELR